MKETILNIDSSILKAINTINNNNILNKIFIILTDVLAIYIVLLFVIYLYLLKDKKRGHILITSLFFSSLTVNLLKVFINRPRPFNNNKFNVKSIGKKTTGASFPSGHTNSSVVFASNITLYSKKIIYIILSFLYVILVGFSRIYLNQHYFTDVITSIFIGSLISFLLSFIINNTNKEEYISLTISISTLVYLIISIYVLKNANPNLFKLTSIYLSFSIGYIIDKNYIKYNPNEKFIFKLINLFIALLGTFLLKEGLKLLIPYNKIEDKYILWVDFLRYFLIGLWLSLICPLIFKLTKITYNKTTLTNYDIITNEVKQNE